jgi:hypothetical protein
LSLFANFTAMMKYQKNSVLLVSFHIVVLLSPLFSKGLHHHDNLSNNLITHHEKKVSQENRHCFICDFEYVNVISPENIKLPSLFTSIFIEDAFLKQAPFCKIAYYYCLRAPPFC